MTKLQHHYGGWRKSPKDPRDLRADHSGIKVLPEVDPRADMPAVYDQGRLGSCTANAVAAAIEYDARLDGRDIGGTPSRLDIYFGERVLEHLPADEDTGAYGRDGFKYAKRTGTIPESDWPYDVSKFDDVPPEDLEHRHHIGLYKAVARRVSAFKAVLSNRQTVAFGFEVRESFESPNVASTGVVPVPAPGERVLGGHEVLLCGFLRDMPHHGLVRNSWGSDWGDGGYCHFPFAILLDPRQSSDLRTIYRPLGV